MPKQPANSPAEKPESNSTPYAPASSTPEVSAVDAAATKPAKASAEKKSAAKKIEKSSVDSTVAVPTAAATAEPPVVTPPMEAPPVVEPSVTSAIQPPAPYAPLVANPAAPYQAAPYQTVPYQAGLPKPPTILSLLSMIFGIVGVVLACCYGAGFLFSVAGIVLGHLGRRRENAKGMALAGLLTGYAGAALSIITWVFLILLALSPLLILPFLPKSGY